MMITGIIKEVNARLCGASDGSILLAVAAEALNSALLIKDGPCVRVARMQLCLAFMQAQGLM